MVPGSIACMLPPPNEPGTVHADCQQRLTIAPAVSASLLCDIDLFKFGLSQNLSLFGDPLRQPLNLCRYHIPAHQGYPANARNDTASTHPIRALKPYTQGYLRRQKMSQFITTMFVSTSPPNHLPPYPTEPKPLLPVFTYAQSQSYVEQELELDARNGTGQTDSVCMETAATWFETLALARPESTYRSPLQRDGDALRPQLASRLSQGNANQAASRPSTPLPGMEDEGAPRELPNYSYKLLPNTKGSPLRSPNPNRSSKDCSGQRQDGKKTSSRDHSVPAQDQTIANKSLLSRFFHSNPRTRAFKPQKSSRGTSSWQLKQYAEATLGSGSLRKAVKLPEGEDRDEWLAVNGTFIRYVEIQNLEHRIAS